MIITVLGGGNGSFAAAGDFALQGHDVRLWRRDADAVAQQRAEGSRIVVKDSRGRHDAKLALVTTDIAEAVRGTELILCPAPAFAQADIARALAPAPRILIADEPTGNLDQATGRQIADLLFNKAKERGMTLVLVTHDPSLAARCARQVAMRSGRIEVAGGIVGSLEKTPA